MFYTALIDQKNKKIEYAEKHKTREEAIRRAEQLALQADLNAAGMNPEAEKHDQLGVYFGDEPFAWPKEEKAAKEPASKETKK